MKHPIKPLSRHIVVLAPEKQTHTASGILLEQPIVKPYAEVVTIGSEVTAVKVGDKIIARGYGESNVTLDGTRYVILAENDILAIMEDD